MVTMRTTFGEIKLALDEERAPKTVANFLAYARAGHYDGTIFHRVIDNFMVQGGGFDYGTIAMARTMEPHSATAQFFINVKDNDFLNHSGKNMQGWGYCVFGKVVEGGDVLEKIRAVPTTSRAGHQDVPVDTVIIEAVTVDNDA